MPPKRRGQSGGGGGKQSRRDDEPPVCIIVSSLSPEGKIAIARKLLAELPSGAALLTSDLEMGRRAAPNKALEVREYTEKALEPPSRNVVVMSHGFGRPSRLAEAVGGGEHARLVAVVDARTFLDDMETEGEFAAELVAAAKDDERAHLADLSPLEVLAELVETADVVALSHTEDADADELEVRVPSRPPRSMLALLRPIPPSFPRSLPSLPPTLPPTLPPSTGDGGDAHRAQPVSRGRTPHR